MRQSDVEGRRGKGWVPIMLGQKPNMFSCSGSGREFLGLDFDAITAWPLPMSLLSPFKVGASLWGVVRVSSAVAVAVAAAANAACRLVLLSDMMVSPLKRSDGRGGGGI